MTIQKTYNEQQTIAHTKKLNELLKILPEFCKDYFTSIEYTKSPRTKVAYAMDLKVFFEFLIQANPVFKNYTVKDFHLTRDLAQLQANDLNEFLRYLKLYDKDGKEVSNAERAVKRKLATLRSFYGYYHKTEQINVNPARQVDMPKIHDKTITRLDINEVAQLLDNVETGEKLTKHQLMHHNKLKVRDLALLSLMLGTGIRVSECVGLNTDDVDFENDRIKITRKGGSETFVYFSDEVHEVLIEYMKERSGMETMSGHEKALFISAKKQRLCVRSVEILVKKYAQTVTTVKHITPHKLRSTYGTNLYQASKDIYLVADVLGHRDVNTTRKHYAEIIDENKRLARNEVRLRESAAVKRQQTT